jgi:hypothetical protein
MTQNLCQYDGLFGPCKEFTTFSVTIPGIEGDDVSHGIPREKSVQLCGPSSAQKTNGRPHNYQNLAHGIP